MEGTAFGRYRLVSLLGRGGMGEVWRAYDTGTDRVVALKLLPMNFAQDPKFSQRFRREAHAAARLQHPHAVPIHDYGEIDGNLFVDMALIEGRDLASVITAGPLHPVRAVAVVEQIARALHAAHKVGLVHRDVKPSNVLLDEDDHAYLIDFGIARATADTKLTGTGATIGTWAYMAPERFTADEATPGCDIYALACVLHESLTGTTPYPGESLERQVAGHLTSPPPRPSLVRPGLPPAFDDVVATGMAKDPQPRYATTKELATAARAALTAPAQRVPRTSSDRPALSRAANPPTVATPAALGPRATRTNRRAFVVAAATILTIAAALTTVLLIARSGPAATGSVSLPFSGLYRRRGWRSKVAAPWTSPMSSTTGCKR
ncbi:Serine/threonine-protein kinase PknH [Mycobacterium basiliense]|uniref:non-specific serine/threonine protein kinase n=1 Tax=Mycobacterium basiliense TaxID=2094119 RepID=A0A3S4CS29_9MYCO|nr:Serine/threonine-protein kinase PknH [Mycobacterium basiliense]